MIVPNRSALIRNIFAVVSMTIVGTTAMSYLLKPTLAEALTIQSQKMNDKIDHNLIQKTQAVVTDTHGRVLTHRPARRHVCTWHWGRRVCRLREW